MKKRKTLEEQLARHLAAIAKSQESAALVEEAQEVLDRKHTNRRTFAIGGAVLAHLTDLDSVKRAEIVSDLLTHMKKADRIWWIAHPYRKFKTSEGTEAAPPTGNSNPETDSEAKPIGVPAGNPVGTAASASVDPDDSHDSDHDDEEDVALTEDPWNAFAGFHDTASAQEEDGTQAPPPTPAPIAEKDPEADLVAAPPVCFGGPSVPASVETDESHINDTDDQHEDCSELTDGLDDTPSDGKEEGIKAGPPAVESIAAMESGAELIAARPNTLVGTSVPALVEPAEFHITHTGDPYDEPLESGDALDDMPPADDEEASKAAPSSVESIAEMDSIPDLIAACLNSSDGTSVRPAAGSGESPFARTDGAHEDLREPLQGISPLHNS